MQIAKAVVFALDCRGSDSWLSLGLSARPLAPVANKPILRHHLETLATAGVRQTAIVTGPRTAAGIRAAIGDGSAWGADVVYLPGGAERESLTSPAVAEFVGSDPVVVYDGGVLMGDQVSDLHEGFATSGMDALVLCPRPRPGARADERLAPTGAIIGPEIHRSLFGDTAAWRETWLDDVLGRLRMRSDRVDVREVEACLPCRGGVEALLDANRQMLEQLVPSEHGERIFGSQIQGPVAVHPSAEIHNSLVRGPAVIGPHVKIADAYVGPYSAIGTRAEINCAEVEHSIVMEDARIRFLDVRLEGSVIGPGAHVTRDFHMPRSMRLTIGQRAEITLS
jgi:glucose-1-phosphate thymidylyltransferase